MRAAAVCCLFQLALVVRNDQVRVSGANRGLPTDDKVAIVLKPSALLFGSCSKGPASTMNVRLQTMKTKSGVIFRRKAVTNDVFTCLAALGSQPLAASSILECSEKTKAAGLKMFRWDGGQCTGYTNGIPKNFALCAGAGSVMLYSVVVEALSPIVSNITLAFLNNTIDAAWDVTHTNSCFPVMYRVSFNNHDTFVSDKLATVSLGSATPCVEYPLTVTPVDANSAVVGSATTVKVVIPKALELFLNLTRGVTAVKASWKAEYTCNPNKQPSTSRPIESYSLKLDDQFEPTNKSTFEFIFYQNRGRCLDATSRAIPTLGGVELTAYDGNNLTLETVTVTLNDIKFPGHRHATASYCIYYQTLQETPGNVGLTYDQLQEFCQKTMFSNPFIFGVAVVGYASELTDLETNDPTISMPSHFMGLKRNSTSGKWVWPLGNEQPVIDPLWESGEPSSAGDCVKMNANNKLAAVSCDATNLTTVCVDYLED